MSNTVQQIIGSPCPLGHSVGIWSLVLKIILVMMLACIPIFTISVITLGHNLYVVKTQEHFLLLEEFEAHQQILIGRLGELSEKVDQVDKEIRAHVK